MGSPVDILDFKPLEQIEEGSAERFVYSGVRNAVTDSTGQLVRIADAPEVGLAEIGTGGIVAGAAEIAGPIAVGVAVEQYLTNNPHWNNFWTNAGTHLSGILDSITGAPKSDAVNQQTLHVNLQFTTHLLLRAIRQAYGKASARTTRQIQNQARANRRFMYQDRTIARAVINNVKDLRTRIVNAQNFAVHHADAVADRALQSARAYTDNVADSLKGWVVRNVQQPLGAQIHSVDQSVRAVNARIPVVAAAVAAPMIASATAPLVQQLKAHSQQLQKLQQENDECNQPMCETVGPKTDWGKLLKKFKPALIFALLAELAAMNPDEVEKAAVSLANGLGPVLAAWTEAFVGVTPGATHTQPPEVSKAIGHIPLT